MMQTTKPCALCGTAPQPSAEPYNGFVWCSNMFCSMGLMDESAWDRLSDAVAVVALLEATKPELAQELLSLARANNDLLLTNP